MPKGALISTNFTHDALYRASFLLHFQDRQAYTFLPQAQILFAGKEDKKMRETGFDRPGVRTITGVAIVVVLLIGAADVMCDHAEVFADWVTCNPYEFIAYTERIHVQCNPTVNGITFFAVSTADPAKAARVLSVLTAAQALGRQVAILYDPSDTSGTAFGCQDPGCRLIQAVGFGQ